MPTFIGHLSIFQRKHTALFLLLTATSTLGQLDVTRGGTETDANGLQQKYAIQSFTKSNVAIVDDPSGGVRKVLKVDVHQVDDKVFGGLRTEVSPLREYVTDGIRWYTISVYFPNDWNHQTGSAIFGQLHTSQDNIPVSPPVAFTVEGANMYLELAFNHRQPADSSPISKHNSARQKMLIGEMQLGKWVCFVIRADWSSVPGVGSMRIWRGLNLIYSADNSYNSYYSRLGNYPKTGLYFPGGKVSTDMTAYVDFIHIGGAKSSLTEMLRSTPCK